jgi:hypothetical protein
MVINITIGALKAEALKMMGVNNALNISELDIDSLKNDPTYGTYIYAMTGAINRCLGRMYTAGALEIEPTQAETNTGELKDISSLAEDITRTLANLIPLYIVGDVFALDEPSVAQNKRNEFEQALDEYVLKKAYNNANTSEIELVYKCE